MRAVVLMSTHNGALFVEQQVHSILRQDHEDLRLVVRDDGSTDGTPDILKSFASDPRIGPSTVNATPMTRSGALA